MKWAIYIRVSSIGQNVAGQKREIQRWLDGNNIPADQTEWFVDTASGKDLERPEFERLQTAVFNGEVRAVGGADEVQARIYQIKIGPGDRLLLCTDGLSDMVTDAQIVDVLNVAPLAHAACDQLVERALDAGGKDNITVVLCDVLATV